MDYHLNMHIPTAAEIEAAKSVRGGWNKETLAKWGIEWPPKRGWRKRLIASNIQEPTKLMTKYFAVSAPDNSQLEKSVNELLSEGWKLHGGISVAACVEPCRENGRGDYVGADYTFIYAQALTREEATPAHRTRAITEE
jgi:hypothetical protein